MNTYLILDVSNILYRSFFAGINDKRSSLVKDKLMYGDDITEAPDNIDTEAALQKALGYMSKYYNKYSANDVVMVFDPEISWRKLYTRSKDIAKTHKIYKGNRRQNLTPSQAARFEIFDQHVNDFHKLIQEKTGVIALRKKYLEADDLIAYFTQKFKDDKHIIISGDKDFLQLLSNGNVTLINPDTDTPRDLSEWEYDANYFMFEKCIRGDAGDNVISSYPRLRSNKIKEAYTDKFKHTNIMKHTFIVEELKDNELKQHEYLTKDIFQENELLMDLTKQPDHIKIMLNEHITEAINNRGKYNYIDFLKYCGRNQLNNIINNVSTYSALLSGKGRK